MKVLAAVVLIIGSASALGSGPYLPSGWKPQGPAFYLPSEPRPPVAVPPQDFILSGSEASGSEFLREYGPPKTQGLPEVATEQAFVVLAAKFSEEKSDAEVVETEAATEAYADLKYEVVDDSASTTESAAVEEVTEVVAEQPAAEGRSLNIEVEASVAEEEVNNVAQVELESTEQVTQEVADSEQITQEVSEVEAVSGEAQAELVEEVKSVEEGVKNIAEAIVSLEKEIVAEQVQFSQDLSAVKSVELSSGSVQQVPEGFLEYGPPGFREYGPPNLNNIARAGDETKSEEEKIESNETRRRRFSPKFRSTKAKKH